jgi:hypothetical protein
MCDIFFHMFSRTSLQGVLLIILLKRDSTITTNNFISARTP